MKEKGKLIRILATIIVCATAIGILGSDAIKCQSISIMSIQTLSCKKNELHIYREQDGDRYAFMFPTDEFKDKMGDYEGVRLYYNDPVLIIPGENYITVSEFDDTSALDIANDLKDEGRKLENIISFGKDKIPAYVVSHTEEGQGEVFAQLTTWYVMEHENKTVVVEVNRSYTNDGNVHLANTVDNQFAKVLSSFTFM